MKDTMKKFKFKDAGLVLNAPAPLEKEFIKPGFKTALNKNQKGTNTLVFITSNKEYLDFLNNHLKNVEPVVCCGLRIQKAHQKLKPTLTVTPFGQRVKGLASQQ